jgi:hypothetical protein
MTKDIDLDALEASTPEEWPMEAYYYGFKATGVAQIDIVLSAVACAGKFYHHTQDWCEPINYCPEHFRGDDCEDRIQNAANDSAETVRALIAKAQEADKLREALEKAMIGMEWFNAEHPEDHSEADNEFLIEVRTALAGKGERQ